VKRYLTKSSDRDRCHRMSRRSRLVAYYRHPALVHKLTSTCPLREGATVPSPTACLRGVIKVKELIRSIRLSLCNFGAYHVLAGHRLAILSRFISCHKITFLSSGSRKHMHSITHNGQTELFRVCPKISLSHICTIQCRLARYIEIILTSILQPGQNGPHFIANFLLDAPRQKRRAWYHLV
jgi:hypothetical protein